MPAHSGIVIVGASLAGAKAAQALRLDHGYDGPITLIGDEPHLPYERPALSKGYLLGRRPRRPEAAVLCRPGHHAGPRRPRHRHPRYLNPVRIEHWDNAVIHGTAAAATMVGERPAIDHVPYFFSTQYGSSLEYLGLPTAWDRIVTRGEFGTPESPPSGSTAASLLEVSCPSVM
jgi:hypothetical protein